MNTLWVSRLVLAVTCGSWCATETLAFQAGWAPSLGAPLLHVGTVAIYSPWTGWVWAWWWAFLAPTAFVRAGCVFVGIAGLCCLRRGASSLVKAGVAQWATRQDLQDAGLMAPHGIVLGKWGRTVLRYDGEAHTLIVAPTRSGKTTSTAIPTLLEWQESVFVHDAKSELYEKTAGWRHQFSQVVRLDPTDPTSDQYNPLCGIRLATAHEIRDTSLIVDMLVDPEGEPVHGGAAQHFRELTIDLHTGVVLHGLYTGQATTLAALDAFFMSEATLESVFAAMRQTAHTRDGCHPAVRRAVHAVRRLADRELSGVQSTASRALRLYLDPLVAHMTNKSAFTLRDLRERVRPFSLYLTIPYSDQERLRPLGRLLVRQFLDYCTQRQHGWKHRMLMLIDEMQALNRLPTLSTALNFVAGYGVRLCLITPSLHELDRLYGRDHNFTESCHVRMVFAPNDDEIAAKFSRMTGMTEVEKQRQSVSEDMGRLFSQRRSSSTERTTEALLSPTALMQLPSDRLLLLVGNAPPALVRKARYFQRRTWRRWSQTPLPRRTP